MTDGTWMVDFEDRAPDTRFPGFSSTFSRIGPPNRRSASFGSNCGTGSGSARSVNAASQIRRITDRDVFRVECDRCGRFEIESGLLDHFRVAYEGNDRSLVDELPRLAEFVGRAKGMPFLTADNWRTLNPGLRRTVAPYGVNAPIAPLELDLEAGCVVLSFCC